MNSANETAVKAFLEGKISFPSMTNLIRKVMDQISYISSPSLDEYEMTHLEAGRMAESLIRNSTH